MPVSVVFLAITEPPSPLADHGGLGALPGVPGVLIRSKCGIGTVRFPGVPVLRFPTGERGVLGFWIPGGGLGGCHS